MVKRMLIDSTHPEETRVVVVNGTRLEELDVETSTKKQIKGNIYLAKVIRVEPSLQAAFVDYGGNRHGFLAFSEIHPDYFQIPAADRQALLAAQKADVQEMAYESARREAARQAKSHISTHTVRARAETETAADEGESLNTGTVDASTDVSLLVPDETVLPSKTDAPQTANDVPFSEQPQPEIPQSVDILPPGDEVDLDSLSDAQIVELAIEAAFDGETSADMVVEDEAAADQVPSSDQPERIKPVNLDLMLDEPSDQELERRRARLLRNYKIQEVIKRRQIMLVQVVKEERGNKGAALTTYLSLAGRYCVLMPNTARGGGVSRKITNTADRRRLKGIASELDCPEGMAVIVRTAGSERSRTEIRRDYEYLLRAWESVRDLTLRSSAPACVYEEASLIKRSIRDLYTRDIDEVLVDGDEGYRLAKDYMRMLTPSHAKKVQPYKDPVMPLFQRFQVEAQLDAMHSPVVQLRSGGYIVIGQTEALVAIDVNSGRATKERHIEETAVKTNLEAAEEIARQLRLRDLAGLIVIDFIDMEENRNNNAVERRLKDALKSDRARIQVGKISSFGLLELSRQRLRPSLQETSFTPCPHCAGTGLIRSVESSAMHVLRAIEEEGIRRRTAELTVFVSSEIALYILNHKRDALSAIEERYQFDVFLHADNSLIAPNVRMERVRAEHRPEEIRPAAITTDIPLAQLDEEEAEDEDMDSPEDEDGQNPDAADGDADGDNRRRRRRRRRKRRGGNDAANPNEDMAGDNDSDSDQDKPAPEGEEDGDDSDDAGDDSDNEGEDGDDDSANERRKRRRGRRGGRRRRGRGRDGQDGQDGQESQDAGEGESLTSDGDEPPHADHPVPAEPAATAPAAAPASPYVPRSLPDAVADMFEQAEQAELARLAAQHSIQPETVTETPAVAMEAPPLESAPTEAESEGLSQAEALPAEEDAGSEEKPVRRRGRKKLAETSAEGADDGMEGGTNEDAPPVRKTRSRKKADDASGNADGSSEPDKPSRKRTRKTTGDEADAPARKRQTRKSKSENDGVTGDVTENATVVVDHPIAENAALTSDVGPDDSTPPTEGSAVIAEPAVVIEAVVIETAAADTVIEATKAEPPAPAEPTAPPSPPRRGWWNKS